MLNMKMSIPQYRDYEKAHKAGDIEKAKRIADLGYQEDYDPTLVSAQEAELISEEEIEDENAAILDDVASGLSNKEIYERYGISAPKLVSIKKGAK